MRTCPGRGRPGSLGASEHAREEQCLVVASLAVRRDGAHDFVVDRFERARGEFHFRHQTNIFGERMTIAGKMWAEPLPAGPTTAAERMVWRTTLTIECTILGVGGLIERAVEHNVHKSWPDCSRHWNRWIPAHPDAGPLR